MAIVLLTIGFLILTLLNLREIYNSNNKRKTLIVCMTLMLVAFTISLLLILNKTPKSPAYIIEAFFKSIM